MTPRRSMVGTVAATRLFRNDAARRAIFAVLIVLSGLLSLFPRTYRAAVTMTPTDPANLGLGGALGQLGAFTSVFGNQAAVEISLTVARSIDTRAMVIKRLDLMRRLGFSNEVEAHRWLEGHVDIRALRGGIIQIDTKGPDAEFDRQIVAAYADATRARLAEINRAQTAYKRSVLTTLVTTASDRLAEAQARYDQFRRATRYTQPSGAIANIGLRVPEFQNQLKAKEAQLAVARKFATDDNMAIRQIIAEIQVLRQQLGEAESLDSNNPYAVNRVITQSSQVQKLERELGIARGLYESYSRFLEGTSVEDLASTGNVRILEPAYVDSDRQFRDLPAALCLLFILTALAIEFYRLRPPLEARGAIAA